MVTTYSKYTAHKSLNGSHFLMARVLVYSTSHPFQSSILIMDIATYRLNQPRGQCSENDLKCITRWEGSDGATNTIFFQHTRVEHKTSYV